MYMRLCSDDHLIPCGPELIMVLVSVINIST